MDSPLKIGDMIEVADVKGYLYGAKYLQVLAIMDLRHIGSMTTPNRGIIYELGVISSPNLRYVGYKFTLSHKYISNMIDDGTINVISQEENG